MLKREFEELAGYEVRDRDYRDIIEPMYMATTLDKHEFVKAINRELFEYCREATEEEKRLRQEMREYKMAIRDAQNEIKKYKDWLATESDEGYRAVWQNRINQHKEEMRYCRQEISKIMFVLG